MSFGPILCVLNELLDVFLDGSTYSYYDWYMHMSTKQGMSIFYPPTISSSPYINGKEAMPIGHDSQTAHLLCDYVSTHIRPS